MLDQSGHSALKFRIYYVGPKRPFSTEIQNLLRWTKVAIDHWYCPLPYKPQEPSTDNYTLTLHNQCHLCILCTQHHAAHRHARTCVHTSHTHTHKHNYSVCCMKDRKSVLCDSIVPTGYTYIGLYRAGHTSCSM